MESFFENKKHAFCSGSDALSIEKKIKMERRILTEILEKQ
jgi:hypothetical protein